MEKLIVLFSVFSNFYVLHQRKSSIWLFEE